MRKLQALLPALAACLLVTACGSGDKGVMVSSGIDQAPVSGHTETIRFADLKAAEPGLHIQYHFTKKENASNLDPHPSAEHFRGGVLRLNEDGKIWYGLYAFEGDPKKDATFRAYYLNHPRDEEDKVLYIQMDYDNRTRRFKEELIMPDGRKVFQEGTFEIVADAGR